MRSLFKKILLPQLDAETEFDHDQSAPEIMSTPPTPTSTSGRRILPRDTGFPEPFGDNYNTTLPHPDANLSPNAIIHHDAIDGEHSMRRRRLSMLHKHRRTMSRTSSIGAQAHAIHHVLNVVDTQIPGSDAAQPSSSAVTAERGEVNTNRPGSGNSSTPTGSSGSARGCGSSAPSSPDSERSRRSVRGLFRKWRKNRV